MTKGVNPCWKDGRIPWVSQEGLGNGSQTKKIPSIDSLKAAIFTKMFYSKVYEGELKLLRKL